MAHTRYSMRINLNVLNHLGLNLYSNVPAVLAEAVANAWDADATHVYIVIEPDTPRIVIEDDGHGMDQEDINEKFLTVGYKRREAEPRTPYFGRFVMGRKGIGKLSLFSIAEKIEVESCKSADPCGLVLSLEKIQHAIEKQEGEYHPDPLPYEKISISKGTRLTLTGLKKQLYQTETALRRRLARRFSVIGPSNHFQVFVNGSEIGVEDRDYYHKLQYVWIYGSKGQDAARQALNAEHTEKRNASFEGWIGTVKDSGSLKDEHGESLNKIVVMVRGKLAQEDILDEFGEGGIYSKYVMGEIQADFLDEDDKPDIATSSRQAIIEEDPRYQNLREEIGKELKYIQNKWTKLRNEHGTQAALENPVINEWFNSLSADNKKRARKLFGRINQISAEGEQRKTLFKHGVLAFESLRYKENLDALEAIDINNLDALASIFGSLDDLEATLYRQIVHGRIQVVKALQDKVEDNALEKIIQKYLFDHLWLLDPSWERAAATEYMEQQISQQFDRIDAGLTEDEEKGRVDIKYRTTGGKHVIIELKRSAVKLSTDDLLPQIRKYHNALKKLLRELGREGEPIEIVCVVGCELKDWNDRESREISARQLSDLNARVVLYKELIENAYKAYQGYLEKRKEAGKVFDLVERIDAGFEEIEHNSGDSTGYKLSDQ